MSNLLAMIMNNKWGYLHELRVYILYNEILVNILDNHGKRTDLLLLG